MTVLDSKSDTGSESGLSGREPPVNPAPVQHGEYSQASRALALGSYFLSGVMAVTASQFLGAPLYLINKDWYNAWIAFTKQSFGLLTTTLTQCWAPTVMRISGDRSMRGQLLKTMDGDLLCNFPERLVLIANHQIYTDWLYLWWIAYTNGMHGRLYIVLKESLRRIPVIGWGMQFCQFIFMKRNWELDKPNMSKHLQKLNRSSSPMWLLLFPEGTNLAPSTRQKSKKWAAQNGIADMQHQLLPRSIGLRFCLQELRGTVEYLYDCTIAYEGVPRGQYAQDIFTLKASYLEGRPPKSVSMYWRRFKISSIPVDDPRAFDLWLRAHWTAKDKLLEGFVRTGRFPAETGSGFIETEVKAARWYEFMQIFAPIGLVGLVLYAFYGSLPKRFVKSLNKENIRQKVETVQKAVATPGKLLTALPSVIGTRKLPIGPVINMITEKKLPVAQAVKALADKDLLIGQFPVGLLLKAASENHLPIGTIQSILKTLSGKGLLKGAVPKEPLERRLLKDSNARFSKPNQVAAAQKPVTNTSVTSKQSDPATSNQKAATKLAVAPTQRKVQTGMSTAKSQVTGIKPTVNEKATNSQAPSMSSKTQALTKSAASKSSGASPKSIPGKSSSAKQKLDQPQTPGPPSKLAKTNNVPPVTAKTPSMSQKATTTQKPVTGQKVTHAQKQSSAVDTVTKTAPIKTLPPKESTIPSPKAPEAKLPPPQAQKAQPKKLQPTASPATRQPATRQPAIKQGTLSPPKLEVKHGARTRPPKLGPSKLTGKSNTPATPQTQAPTRKPTGQPLKKPGAG